MTHTEARVTYEALQEAQGPRRNVFPLCTVDYYEGDRDAEGGFHGKGLLESCMGFTYTGGFERGQIAGQGTMTWADGYSSEGLFRGGVPNGISTITWPNGDAYVGEVVNGVRHGGGSMSMQQGKATYDGAWAHGVRCGWGRQCYPDGAVYEGGWKGGRHHGHGTLTYASGDCYDGEWVAGVREGHGVMGWKHGNVRDHQRYAELYDGQWHEGAPHGQGQSIYIVYATPEAAKGQQPEEPKENATESKAPAPAAMSDNDVVLPSAFAPPADAIVNTYRGSFVKGVRSGWGTLFYSDGSSYEGEWADGRKNGRGTFTTAVGATYHGVFANDIPVDLPPLASINGAGPAAVPTVNISDLRGIGDDSEDATLVKMTSLLLRYNTTLKALFHSYAVKADSVAFVYTPQDWWRHRVPGHISVPQLLRLLSDANLVDGLVTVSTVLRCAMKAVLADAPEADEPIARAFRTAAADDIARANGWLSYCQFTETLIRLAPSVCLGISCGGGICNRFSVLVEERLKAEMASVPLCPLTRQYAADLDAVLAPLEGLYQQLLRLEHEDAVPPTKRFLPVRSLLRFLQPLLSKEGLSLQEAIRVMCPFQRSSSASRLPPGFNVSGRDRQLALAQELYTTGCGKENHGAASLLASGVIVELELSLIDFVEALVALSLAMIERAHSGSLQHVIQARILSLPL